MSTPPAIVPLEARHVSELCDIHLASWAPFELSVKLGRGYVRRFYQTIAGSATAFGYVATLDGRIVGYATGFWDYPGFYVDLLRGWRLPFYATLAARMLSGRITWTDLSQARKSHRDERLLQYHAHHQNGLALREEFKGTPLGKQVITDLIQRVLDAFREARVPGCWGRTDARNRAMQAYYRKLGFTDVTLPDPQRARYVYFETAL